MLNGWILPIGGVASGRACAYRLRSMLLLTDPSLDKTTLCCGRGASLKCISLFYWAHSGVPVGALHLGKVLYRVTGRGAPVPISIHILITLTTSLCHLVIMCFVPFFGALFPSHTWVVSMLVCLNLSTFFLKQCL